LWGSTVGKKALVAASGLLLSAWVLLHLLGNLTVFAGPAAADGYAAKLHGAPGLLWAVRLGLLAAALVHVAGVLSLARRARCARPVRASPPRHRASTLASRTMGAGGLLLLAFVVLHLLHLTFGVIHPRFQPGRVYDNVVLGLRAPAVAAGYAAAAGLLGLHLFHGLWGAVRSLGLRQRTAGSLRRPLVAVLATAVAAGFASVPLAVLAGVLR
jgi:succinate dehydrogenase / fumarate reductase cytochrome b subunit